MTAQRKKKQYYGETAKRGAAWAVIRQGGHELVAVPMSMVMARLLTPSEFGVAVAATFFVLLAARLSQFGFNAALVRTKELRPEHTSSVFLVSLATGAMSYVALVAAAPFIGRFFNSPEAGALIPVAALTFLITPFGAVPTSLITRRMQFRYATIADWTDTVVGAVVTIALALAGWSYWSIAYGQVVAAVVRVALKMYLAAWRPSFVFSRHALGELMSYGLGIQTKRLLEYAAFNLDTLVVGRMLDLTALGFYDKAFSTMNRLVNRLTLGQAPFRIFAIIHEDVDRFRRAYTRLILSITMLAYPALVGCIVVAEPLFEVLYGGQWSAAVLPFQILCVGGMMKLLNAYASQANEAVGAVWQQAGRQAVGAVLVVAGAAVGAHVWGIPGAALGVTAALTVLTVSMQALVRRATGLRWTAMLAPQIPALACAVLLAGVLVGAELLLRRFAPAPPAWQLLPVQMGAGLLFFLAFVLFSPFAALRDVVRETASDILPGFAARAVLRITPGHQRGA